MCSCDSRAPRVPATLNSASPVRTTSSPPRTGSAPNPAPQTPSPPQAPARRATPIARRAPAAPSTSALPARQSAPSLPTAAASPPARNRSSSTPHPRRVSRVTPRALVVQPRARPPALHARITHKSCARGGASRELQRLLDGSPWVGRLPVRASLRAPALWDEHRISLPTITGLDTPTARARVVADPPHGPWVRVHIFGDRVAVQAPGEEGAREKDCGVRVRARWRPTVDWYELVVAPQARDCLGRGASPSTTQRNVLIRNCLLIQLLHRQEARRWVEVAVGEMGREVIRASQEPACVLRRSISTTADVQDQRAVRDDRDVESMRLQRLRAAEEARRGEDDYDMLLGQYDYPRPGDGDGAPLRRMTP
ncbi:hypothetical protein IMY05_C4588000400 [Salix suchowensis]|nr:hypothetical protein IMY05_C4588000400 [Salix suchowensis]